MKILIAATALLLLSMITGCYTQIYVAPDEPGSMAAVPPAPEEPINGPIPPTPPDPCLCPTPQPIILIVPVAAPAAPPDVHRDSGNRRTSDPIQADRMARAGTVPTRGR